jgi:uncharacterized protein (DUF305 family)
VSRVLPYTIVALIFAALGGWAWQQHRALQAAHDANAAWQPGPIEIGFAQAMSRHHQQAIGLSQLMLDGRPTALFVLARSIAGTQLLELGEMQGWLRLWQQPFVSHSRGMDWMLLGPGPLDAALTQYLLDCERSPTGMVGLATDAEVSRLRRIEGRERDLLFLNLMLAHHEGGIPMARFAAEQARIAAVRRLAAQIVREQYEEIARIRRMLEALPSMQD